MKKKKLEPFKNMEEYGKALGLEGPSEDCSAATCSPIAFETKPPLGVMPKNIWQWKRCQELARAIHQYFDAGMTPSQIWIEELSELFPEANG